MVQPWNHHIQFRAEAPNEQGAILFMDMLVSIGPNGSLIISVYRKSLHRDHYLHWDSHFSISTTHRACTICSDQELCGWEQQHIRTALNRCNYFEWVFHRLQTKKDLQLSLQDCNNNTKMCRDKDNKTNNNYIVVLYSKGLS